MDMVKYDPWVVVELGMVRCDLWVWVRHDHCQLQMIRSVQALAIHKLGPLDLSINMCRDLFVRRWEHSFLVFRSRWDYVDLRLKMPPRVLEHHDLRPLDPMVQRR